MLPYSRSILGCWLADLLGFGLFICIFACHSAFCCFKMQRYEVFVNWQNYFASTRFHAEAVNGFSYEISFRLSPVGATEQTIRAAPTGLWSIGGHRFRGLHPRLLSAVPYGDLGLPCGLSDMPTAHYTPTANHAVPYGDSPPTVSPPPCGQDSHLPGRDVRIGSMGHLG